MSAMKQDTLIALYRILEAVQKQTRPDPAQVSACFIAIRDALLQPDTEHIVDHIRDALEQQQAAADALTDRVIGGARTKPLPDDRLIEMMSGLGAPAQAAAEVAVAFGRLVEAAHGIRA